MINPSSVHRRWSSESATPHVSLVVSLLFALAACSGDGIVGPARSTPAAIGRASAEVTSSYTTFDTRAQFNAAGTIDHFSDFEEFVFDLVLPIDPPWTTNGVTYTSAGNILLGPNVGLGVSSNVVSADFGAPLTGQFADADAFNLFGADLSLFAEKTPVGLVITTNLGTYSFPNLDVPSAETGRRFFGIVLANANEHLRGFRFTLGGDGSAMLLDNVAVGHASVQAANADPEASVGGPYTGLEGSSVALSMNATDADGDALTFSWDLGDGTTGTGATPPSSHVYADNGTYNVMLAVADGRGGVDTARTTATIANVAPSLAAFSVPSTPLAVTSGGVTLPVSSTFTDPGTLDTHTATLDCGVGGTTQSSAPNGTAGGSCTFSSPGVYTITLAVSDNDGGSDTKVATGTVVVFDPASWITGGGWITPPSGYAYVKPKLMFNVGARYESGATVPTGNVDVRTNVGTVDFHSTSFDWLVVADDGIAQLQGRGTMNGAGDYGFAVITRDDAPTDAIRVRIWNLSTGAIVYDSRPSDPFDGTGLAPLTGGSLQQHQH